MNVIRLHPKFPALGTPQEQEAFAVKYKQTMDRIRACNEEAKGVKEQVSHSMSCQVLIQVHFRGKHQTIAVNPFGVCFFA